MLNLDGVSRMNARSIVALQQRIEVRLAGKNLERYFRVDFYHDGNSSVKSLQRDVIVAGRWVTG